MMLTSVAVAAPTYDSVVITGGNTAQLKFNRSAYWTYDSNLDYFDLLVVAAGTNWTTPGEHYIWVMKPSGLQGFNPTPIGFWEWLMEMIRDFFGGAG